MLICTFCNKQFKNRRSFALHLSRIESIHFKNDVERELYLVNILYGRDVVQDTIQKYMKEEVSADELYKTIDIVKLLKLMGVKRTHQQEKLTARYRLKYEDTMMRKYGVKHVSQVPEFRKKVETTICQKYGSSYAEYLEGKRSKMKIGYQKYLDDSERVKDRWLQCQIICEEKYGHKNFGLGEKAREKARSARQQTVASWGHEERLLRTSKAREAVCHRGGGLSKPEKRVRHALVELDIDFKTNVHLWHYNYDMVFDNVIIEVQGDMWHAHPDKYKPTDLIMGKILAADIWEKDRRKKDIAEKRGFVLVEVWECDIMKKDDQELIDFLHNKLEEIGYVGQ